MEFTETEEDRGRKDGGSVADFLKEHEEDFNAARNGSEVAFLCTTRVTFLYINDLKGQLDEALD